MTKQLSKTKRIKAVRDMAHKLRNVATVNSIYRFHEMEDLIKKQERQHRRGGFSSRGYSQSVPVAADYFIVRTFAHAFRDIRKCQTKEDLLTCLMVRTDYLLALAIVAQYGERFTSCIHIGELIEASEMLDYSEDIA
jgi:hypothetical protein